MHLRKQRMLFIFMARVKMSVSVFSQLDKDLTKERLLNCQNLIKMYSDGNKCTDIVCTIF